MAQLPLSVSEATRRLTPLVLQRLLLTPHRLLPQTQTSVRFALRLSCPRLRAAFPPCFTQRVPATGCTSHALRSNALRWTSRKIFCAAPCVPPAGGPTPMTCGSKQRVPHEGIEAAPRLPAPSTVRHGLAEYMPSAPSRPMMHDVSPRRQPTSRRCAADNGGVDFVELRRPSQCVGTPVSWPGACHGFAHAAHAVHGGMPRVKLCAPLPRFRSVACSRHCTMLQAGAGSRFPVHSLTLRRCCPPVQMCTLAGSSGTSRAPTVTSRRAPKKCACTSSAAWLSLLRSTSLGHILRAGTRGHAYCSCRSQSYSA